MKVIGAQRSDETWRHATGYKKKSQWEDVLTRTLGIDWMSICRNGLDVWTATIETFIVGAYSMVGEQTPGTKPRTVSITSALMARPPRQVEETSVEWDDDVAGATRLEIIGDSLTVIKWHQGAWHTNVQQYVDRISATIDLLGRQHRKGRLLTRAAATDFHRHVFRELNKRADFLANALLDGTLVRWSYTAPAVPSKISVHFDGGKRGGGPAAAAWTLEGQGDNGAWAVLAEGGTLLNASASVTDAELTGQEEAVKAALSFLEYRRVSWNHNGNVLFPLSTCCK